MYRMSRYNCNFSYFRTSVPIYHTTNTYDNEKNVINEIVEYLTLDPIFVDPILEASYFMEVEQRSGSMTQTDYCTYMKTVILTFNSLLDWCNKYDKLHDFNNFESGWSVSLSVYHTA
jgi:hypothetical protein